MQNPNPQDKNIIDIRNKYTGGDNTSDIEKVYLEECNKLIDETVKTVNNELKLKYEYNGFEELEDSQTIVAFFEKIDDNEIKLTNSAFAIINDITNNKIIDAPLSEKILKLFNKNPGLLNMKDDDDNKVDNNPIPVYLCKQSGLSYENVDTSNTETSPDTDLKVHHDIFGDVYLFTTEPITSLFNVFTTPIKRFALFTENSFVIDSKMEVSDYLLQHQSEKATIFEHKTISFKEGGRQYWAVRSKLLFTEIQM